MALLHEWYEKTGGSEQVFDAMSDVFPAADRWVLWQGAEARFSRPTRTTWLDRTPLRGRKAAALPVMPLVWRTQATPGYDVVLSSSHAFAHTARLRSSPDARYLTYVHTPARYVWSPELDVRGQGLAARLARGPLAQLDRRLHRHVDAVAVNSAEVRRRVQRFWDVDATVISPPVDVGYFGMPAADGDLPAGLPDGVFALAAGRWVPYKRFDLAIAAAACADVPLVIAGGGPEESRLRDQAARSSVPVVFVSNPSRAALRALYQAAAVFVFGAHEDFGMTPVEAQAAGTPVAALAAGGSLETVRDGVTGVLAPTDAVADLTAAIEKALSLEASTDARNHAQAFSVDSFNNRLKTWIEEISGSAIL